MFKLCVSNCRPLLLVLGLVVAVVSASGCRRTESQQVDPAVTPASTAVANESDKQLEAVPSDLDLETLRVLKACRDTWRGKPSDSSP